MLRTCWGMLLLPATLWAVPPAYVVNNASASISIVDLGTRQSTGVINVGVSPQVMLILPDNRTGLLTEVSGVVRRLDLKRNVSVATIPVGAGPASLLATPDMRFLYVANEDSNDVSVVDLSRNLEIQRIAVGALPIDMAMRPDGRFVYVVNQNSDSISIIDTSRNALVNTVFVGQSPTQFLIEPQGRLAYIPDWASNSLTIFNLNTNSVVTTLVLQGLNPITVNFSPDGNTVYAVMNGSAGVNVVDARNSFAPRVIANIPVGFQPTDLAVNFSGRFGYVACRGSNEVWVIDFASNGAGAIPAGPQPFSVQFDPYEVSLYVTELGDAKIRVIDISTNRIVGSIDTGSFPVQLAQLNNPTIPPRSLVNGASFAPATPVAAGSIASLFGLGLAVVDADGLLIRSFGGTQVNFRGAAAPLYAVHDNQINLQVPTGLTGDVPLDVVSPNGTAGITVTIVPVYPGIFSITQDGRGPGAILHSDFSPVSSPNPAVAGEVVLIFLTGLGATTPPVPDGQRAPVANVNTSVTVKMGGTNATVQYAGTAPGFAGLYQINAVVPALSSGPAALTVTAGGFTSNQVTIAIR